MAPWYSLYFPLHCIVYPPTDEVVNWSSYIKSAIRSPTYEAELIGKGVEFAPQEDVSKCFMRIATDRTMNGYSSYSPCIQVVYANSDRPLADDHAGFYCEGGIQGC